MLKGRSTAKARITGRVATRQVSASVSSPFGWTWNRGKTKTVTYTYWNYEVIDSHGKVVLADGCSDYQKTLNAALSGVGAVRRLENSGHKIRRSYAELVERWER